MQQKLCLRLIKDKKIVGRKWTLSFDDAAEYISFMEYNDPTICAGLSGDSLVDIYLPIGEEEWTFEVIDYDSFEFGIEVGDEDWFEGDILQWDIRNQDEYKGIIKFDDDNNVLYLDFGKAVRRDPIKRHNKYYLFDREFKLKRIGNIHEEAK